MTPTNAPGSRQRPHVHPFCWIAAAALVAIALLPGAIVEGVSASHGTAAPIAAGNQQVEADPSATPDPSPTAPVGYWEGTVVVGDETDTRVAISLESCDGGSCGEITLPEADGVGCSYDLQHVEPDDEGLFLPAEPPLADDQLVYLVGSSCVDCAESWLDGTTIYVRPTSGGGIEVTPVELLDLVPVFSLAAASRPAPQPAMDLAVDRTTLVRGEQLTVAVTGFLSAFVLIESDAGDVPIGPVDLDERGSGTLVAPVPRNAPLGPANLIAEGVGRDHCEGGAAVRVTVVSDPGSATALPTPPATDTEVSDAAPGSDAWRVILVGLAGLITGGLVIYPRRTTGPRR